MSEIHAYRITCGCLNCLREKDRRMERDVLASRFADAADDVAALTARLKEAEDALETIRNMDVYVLTDGPHAICDPAHRFAAAIDKAREYLSTHKSSEEKL